MTFNATNPAKILIVDDHALVRFALTELLSNETGLQVTGAVDNSDEALRMVVELTPDLVVIDIKLKGHDGIELIKRIKARVPRTKMLVSSMYDESLYAGRALQAGAAGFVNKQEATETLIAAIHHVLSGKIYLSAEASQLFMADVTNATAETAWSPVRRLSDRELEVFELIGRGLTTREIATRLHLSVKTIETHRENIKDKLDLKNAVELNRHAVQWVIENG